MGASSVCSQQGPFWRLSAYLPSGVEGDYRRFCPGDTVHCDIVKKGRRHYYAALVMIARGAVGQDIDEHGEPADYRISYSRYIRCCGIDASRDQHASNCVSDSAVFRVLFCGCKVRWSGTVLGFLRG